MPTRRFCGMAAVILAFASLVGCQSQVQRETAALTLSSADVAREQHDSRWFDTTDQTLLLRASAGVLQDLGFTLEDSASNAGFVLGAKDRSAIEGQEVAAQLLLAILVAAAGGHPDPTWDRNQKIRVSVVTRPAREKKGIIVQVTFQRVVWNTKDQVSNVESINEPKIYQGFFERLSKAVFLTAHGI